MVDSASYVSINKHWVYEWWGMGDRDCSGGNQDANGDFVSYINTFDLGHFQTLLSKIASH